VAALLALAVAACTVATAGPAKPKDAKPADKTKADAKAAPAPAPAPRVDAPDTRKYPTNRAAELKARLLERPKDPAAAAWAVEYAGTPEVARLDPVTRVAEQAWAARTGLASGPATAERPALEAILTQVGSCPLDSVPVKRARILALLPFTSEQYR